MTDPVGKGGRGSQVVLKPLPFQEAIDYFRAKTVLPSYAYQDVWEDAHASVFVMGKGMQLDIVQDVRDAMAKALAEGKGQDWFIKNLTPILQAKGWWGQKAMIDPDTGEEKIVQLGSPRRLKTIFDVNLRMARAAGNWVQIQRVKDVNPYLRYVAVLDDKTRPQHRAWHGTVLKIDHPWWDTHYPPCGWNCRCHVMQLSDRDLKRWGFQVSPDPEIVWRPWTNKRTGTVLQVPDGIDPGFGYNVGKAGVRATAARSFMDKMAAADATTGSIAWDQVAPEALQGLMADFGAWVKSVQQFGKARGEIRPVGGISSALLAAVSKVTTPPQSAAIWLHDDQILHALRASKAARGAGLSLAQFQQLPTVLTRPDGVVLDREDPGLLFLWDLPQQGVAKAVVRVDYAAKGRTRDGDRIKARMNVIRTTGIVQEGDLAADRYVGLIGKYGK